jgi:hypothetical protein
MSGRPEQLRRRNLYLALAISLFALTFLFYPSEEGMRWMMWRDTPLLAAALTVTAAGFAWRWWRATRS